MTAARPATLRLATEADLVGVVAYARDLSRRLGFADADQARCATAVSELARNVLKYAREGRVTLRGVTRATRVGLEALVEDEGPGIADLELALRDHYSTGGSLGLGLGGVKRLMDELHIDSTPGAGTRVRIVKWRGP